MHMPVKILRDLEHALIPMEPAIVQKCGFPGPLTVRLATSKNIPMFALHPRQILCADLQIQRLGRWIR